MFERKEFSVEVGGKKLTLEISPLAEQANAAVLAKYGETAVLATVVMSDRDSQSDYLPLKVDYEEKFYAAGKIIGSRYIRRESRPSDEAILAGRLVDRTIRPLFDHRTRRDIQVVLTVLSWDGENDPEFPGIIAASFALLISDIPWAGPTGGVRVVKIGSDFKINPNNSEIKDKKPPIDAFVAGPAGKINMIETSGDDAQEEDLLTAFGIAQKEIDNLIEFQKKASQEIAKKKTEIKIAEANPELQKEVYEFLGARLEEAMYPHLFRENKKPLPTDKLLRQRRLGELRKELFAHLEEKYGKEGKTADISGAEAFFEKSADDLVHKNILEKDLRPDGRALDEVRALYAEVGLLPRTHGSALFVRGNTQSLAITTLAAPGQEQLIETMETIGKRRFLLHYNFPPFSVGEVKPLRGPGRREIGHGYLAYKAIEPLIPTQDEFPYTIRVVSEILSSNGSSSMATVCASSLSLMDAGVPIKKAGAGIAMGLMTDEEGAYKVLTDIQGPEDHYGDMDFKVAGTDSGVNAVQLDVKIGGLTSKMIKDTLAQAKKARLEILVAMKSAIAAPRAELSKYAPRIYRITIPKDKIGKLIGPGGKMINSLIEKYELASIDIEEDGRVFVASDNAERADKAMAEINSLTREFRVGEIVEGNIIKIMDFGAIVDLGGGQDGMIHVSELKNGFVKTVTDAVKLGDFVRAKIIRVDTDGHIGLSIKQLQ